MYPLVPRLTFEYRRLRTLMSPPKGKTPQPVDSEQLFFEELDERLEAHIGAPLRLEMAPGDVGGELIALLSKGLYTNPLDCIREYVQNSVDARARAVTIQFTGRSIQIFDDGAGMGLKEIVQARQFGLSGKSINEHVGFRGIGIYSGFDLCQRLSISSLQAGEPYVHVLVFDFGAMRQKLEAERKRGGEGEKTPLTDLLSAHTSVTRIPSTFEEDKHFTSVELQEISDMHLRRLSNRVELRKYLLQNLPIDFSPTFPHRDTIRRRLDESVPGGYNAITVTLQSDGVPDEVVATYAPEDLRPPPDQADLQAPLFHTLQTSAGHPVAFLWACLNNERSRVQPRTAKDKEYYESKPNYEGFVYKVKGFTIGDRDKLRPRFTRKPQLYPWYTGEIYVLDPNVVPNAERDDFETNHAKAALDVAVTDLLGRLETEAETFQAQGVAEERVQKYQQEVAGFTAQIESNTHASDYDAYTRLNDIAKDLGRQKLKVPLERKAEAEELLKRTKALQKQIRREIDAPTAETRRRTHANRDDRRTASPGAPVPVVVPPPAAESRTIPDLLRNVGWELDGLVGTLADLVQGSLEDVVGGSSSTYRLFIQDLETRLASLGGDD